MSHLNPVAPKPRFLALAAILAGALFAGSAPAAALPAHGLAAISVQAEPVEPAASKRHYRYYHPGYAFDSQPRERRYGHRYYGGGEDEIRELQRLFPETNWPPSMRYYRQ